MTESSKGWVIYNPCHPTRNEEIMFPESFRRTRTECIKEFVKGSGNNWAYWRKEWGYKCVKAKSTVEIL